MIRVIFALFIALTLAACKPDAPSASSETSPGGVAFTLLTLPGNKDVSIQIAWPTDWAYRAAVNHAAEPVGASLILAGGAEGFPAGEVVETFADLDAEAELYVSVADHLMGELTVTRENLDKAVEIANAHLRAPTLDSKWFIRIRDEQAQNIREFLASPVNAGFEAVRWAVFGAQPLRDGISLGTAGVFDDLSRDDVVAWHRQIITAKPEAVVIAGDISAKQAGKALDDLLAGLPDTRLEPARNVTPDFSPRRILLHLPDAKTTQLSFIAPLPPTSAGGELNDLLLLTALGGDDQSVLFDAVRTRLRAAYGFGAGLANYTRKLRVMVMTGAVEPGKVPEVEAAVRAAYAAFRQSGPDGILAERKAPFVSNFEALPDHIIDVTRSDLQSALDGFAPGRALTLIDELNAISDDDLRARLANAFPAPDNFIVIAVSPDANVLPGACVITAPREAETCP